MNYSEELDYLSSTLKLDQPYKTEERYIKNVSIKDKNELLNHIKNIYQGLSVSAETMEYIYYNNFKFNKDQNPFPEWTTNEILYKLGKESPNNSTTFSLSKIFLSIPLYDTSNKFNLGQFFNKPHNSTKPLVPNILFPNINLVKFLYPISKAVFTLL